MFDTYYTKQYEAFWSIPLVVGNKQYSREINTTYINEYGVFSGLDIAYPEHYALFSGVRHSLYLAIRRVFIDTACSKQYAVFSGGRYYLYWAIRSIFTVSLPLVVGNTEYFRGVDTTFIKQDAEYSGFETRYTKQYAVFSGVRHSLY